MKNPVGIVLSVVFYLFVVQPPLKAGCCSSRESSAAVVPEPEREGGVRRREAFRLAPEEGEEPVGVGEKTLLERRIDRLGKRRGRDDAHRNRRAWNDPAVHYLASGRRRSRSQEKHVDWTLTVEVTNNEDGQFQLAMHQDFSRKGGGPEDRGRIGNRRVEPLLNLDTHGSLCKMCEMKAFYDLKKNDEFLQSLHKMRESLIAYQGESLRTVSIGMVERYEDLQSVLEALCWKTAEGDGGQATNPTLRNFWISNAKALSPTDRVRIVEDCCVRFPNLESFIFSPLPQEILASLPQKFPHLKNFSRRKRMTRGVGSSSAIPSA